ncbi:hypothetical protein GCM10009737_12190 [Nocardioides lentus]|uniref:Flavin reductase like domain-containing protein n=1 Tax=Nocardioides lentus TaxID=338077 RepID=A0ABP5AHC4_9ACTN
MTIHDTHPFAEPPETREPGRRLRGRVTGTVSLWTAGEGGGRAGLTVSSWLVVAGERTRLLGLLDPDSDLADAIEDTGRAVVQLLTWPDRDLAEAFAGAAPAPGGLFAQATFVDTAWGPRLASSATWAGGRLESATSLGWSQQVVLVVEHLELGDEDPTGAPLEHRRGRYRRPGGPEGR